MTLPKPERDGDVLFVPVALSLRERLDALRTAVGFLFTTKIDVHQEDGTWVDDQPFPAEDRIGCFFSGIDTFLRGYRYRFVDLKQNGEYQTLKLLEEVASIIDPNTRKVVTQSIKDGSWFDN